MTPSRSHTDAKRLFWGIPLPEHITSVFRDFITRHEHLYGIRWVPDPNQHVTIVFIGDTRQDDIGVLCKKLAEVADNTLPFSLDFDGIAPGPSVKNARMIWGRFKSNSSFSLLVKNASEAVAEFSASVSHEEAIPHVTLARFKQFRNLGLLDFRAAFERKTMDVNHAVLWQSILKQDGAQYIPLKTFDFTGGH